MKLAGCILLDDENKIALLHRNKKGVTQWELPGGKVEPGERNEDAAKREMLEELGVRVTTQKEVGSTRFEEAGNQLEYVWFLASIVKGNPRICEPETFDDFRYFALEELAGLELSGNMRQLFKRIQSGDVGLRVDAPGAV